MSEMQLYKNQILEEKGDFDAALAHLDVCISMIRFI